MSDKARQITDNILRYADRPLRIRGLVEMAGQLDVGAKVTTKKNGDTVITIPAKAGK